MNTMTACLVTARRRARARHLAAWLGSLGLGVASIAGAVPETVEEIRSCIQKNAPETSSLQTVLLRALDRDGDAVDTRAKIYWKRLEADELRVALHVLDPPTRRGSAVLLSREDGETTMWMYLPELRKVRKINSTFVQGSMFGTDITYEDFERLQDVASGGQVTRLPDRELDGRRVWVIEGRPAAGKESAYEKVVSLVDQERCITLRAELVGVDGEVRKVVSAAPDKITREPFGWLPRRLVIEDRDEGTSTEVVVETFDANVPIPDGKLSITALDKGEF